MMTAQKNRARRAVAAAALAVLALGVTSCGAINEQATSFQYAASDGIVLNVADIEVRNLMLVSKSANDEARLIGSIINPSATAQTLNLKLSTGSVSIQVPAKSVVDLEKDANKKVIPATGVTPGLQAQATLSIDGSSVAAKIPVVDGTLEEYRQFVPGGFDSSDLEHLVPSPKPEGH